MDEVYDKYYNKIFNWAIKKTNNKEDAEDLTNNIFLGIFTYFKKDISVKVIDNLIWKIAHNTWCVLAKKYIKEKDNISYDVISEPYNNTQILDKIIYREIINNLSNIGLTKKEEQIFKLYYLNDLSIKDISNILNIKISNIKYYLYSARNKIKERYDEKD